MPHTAARPSALLSVYAQFPVRPVSGRGSWLIDEAGERWLDAYGGHAVSSTGHSHPAVVRAVAEQAAQTLLERCLADVELPLSGVLRRIPRAAGLGLDSGKHAASISAGSPGVLHGNRTYLMADDNGQIIETHSVSAGLDYPGVGPEHAWLKDLGRAEYQPVTDSEALAAFHTLCRIEGIIPALESSHALAYAAKLAPTLDKDKILLVNLSGRGDKDTDTALSWFGLDGTPDRSMGGGF